MSSNREIPVWALPVAVVICAFVVALIGWRVFAGDGEVGPSKAVRAGMYDIRNEIQKSRAAQGEKGSTQSK
jgi:hypothetical protein